MSDIHFRLMACKFRMRDLFLPRTKTVNGR